MADLGWLRKGETMERKPEEPKKSIEQFDALTGLDEKKVKEYLENGSGINPEEEAQGSVFTVITLVAMC